MMSLFLCLSALVADQGLGVLIEIAAYSEISA
jgi:hypothetical protein